MANKKKSFLESLEAEVVKDAGEFVREKVKKKAIVIGEISILITLGFIMISFGLANFIGYYFPVLNNGLNYLILGVFFLLRHHLGLSNP